MEKIGRHKQGKHRYAVRSRRKTELEIDKHEIKAKERQPSSRMTKARRQDKKEHTERERERDKYQTRLGARTYQTP
jgi:hypothetical protein